MEIVKQQYETRTTETLRAVKTAMAFAPRQIWKCDARIHKLGIFLYFCVLVYKKIYISVKLLNIYVKTTKIIVTDETYTKLTQLFQGYIVNEVDLNKDSSCRENCAYYEYSKVYGCYKNQFCAQQRKCNGRILKCEYIDSDMWICPSVNRKFSCLYNNVTKINKFVNYFSLNIMIEDMNT